MSADLARRLSRLEGEIGLEDESGETHIFSWEDGRIIACWLWPYGAGKGKPCIVLGKGEDAGARLVEFWRNGR
jgi:hypothetical protein